MLTARIELAGIGAFDSAHIARVLDHRHLKSKAQPEVRHLLLAGISNALDLSFGATDAEAAGNDDPVTTAEPFLDVGGVDRRRIQPLEIHISAKVRRTMFAGLDDAG